MVFFKTISILSSLSIGASASLAPVMNAQKAWQKSNSDINPLVDIDAGFIKKLRLLLGMVLNNSSLTNPTIVKELENKLKGSLSYSEDLDNILRLFGPHSPIEIASELLALDGAKESEGGNSPLEAMKNFISHSPQGNRAQAKRAGTKGEGHYVEIRASDGSGTDFYEYMAGVNVNYMFKELSGTHYLGEMISDCLKLGPTDWGFDNQKFQRWVENALNNLKTDFAAQGSFFRAIIPIIKTRVLKTPNPVNGIRYLTGDLEENFEQISLKRIIERVRYLFTTSQGKQDLKNILADILRTHFSEDFILDLGALGYYTFPEALGIAESGPISDIIGNGVNADNLASIVHGPLLNFYNDQNIDKSLLFLQSVFESIEPEDLDFFVNINIFAKRMKAVNEWKDTEEGMEKFLQILTNKQTSTSLMEVIALLGGNPGKKAFVKNSPLFHFQQSVDDSDGMFNQFLDLLELYLP